MSLWRHLTYGLRSLLHRTARDRDVADEVAHYYEQAAADLTSRGFSPEAARRASRTRTTAQEQLRSYGWENALAAFAGDLRFALRQLWKHPAFAATAILTLALGIGANTAIFTVVQSVLLAPLPYHDANTLAVLDTRWTNSGHTIPRVTGPDGSDIRGQSHSLAYVSLYSPGNLGVQLRDHAVFTRWAAVDVNFAQVFRLHPIAGRLFTDADDHRAVLVSEQFARDNFGSLQAALGQSLAVEKLPLQIVGVLPASFDFPEKTQVWEAFSLHPQSLSRTAFNYRAVARLRPGATFQAAQAELDAISRRLELAYPDDNRNKQIVLQPLQQALTAEARPTLLLLWAAVALILLIACVNVTHLQLVRSIERQRELAIRKALGSSRWQVMRPVILESLLLSLLGGGCGILLAIPAMHALLAIAPEDLPRAAEIHLNAWVLAFTLGLSLIAMLVSSILPARQAARVSPADALKHDSSRGIARHGTSSLRDGLVVAEITMTFVLATGAGLLMHTMAELLTRDMGYQASRLLVVNADTQAHSSQDAQRVVQQYDQLFHQLAALPGVQHVAGIMGLPTGNYGSNGNYVVKGSGQSLDRDRAPWANFSVASPGYFQTMGIPLKRGRDFSSSDLYSSSFVAVISEAVAAQAFAGTDPLGKQIQCGLDSDTWMTVIGVVGDVRQASPAEQPGPTLYMPMSQHPFYANEIHIVLRTRVPPLTLMTSVRDKILETNPLIALRFTTMDAMLTQSMTVQRFRAALVSSFAAVGLLLAMLGVYGTMAYTVAQSTFEIGLRMAFGADKSAILRGILHHAAKLAGCGVALGLLLSFALARLIAGMLVGVGPLDPVSLGLASALILITAMAAAFAPGWKATSVDPMVALRAE
jgi:putative ABC transport system permease protein